VGSERPWWPLMFRAQWITPSVILLLASCQPAPHTLPVPDDANARAVLGFLRDYGRRDLEGMMKHLEEDAVFHGSGGDLSKAQIRDFFQASFRKHPNLRVEVGTLKVIQGAIHASVKVETDTIWADTWVFEMRGHKIRAYSLATGKR
jgi:SnoaL-like domain